MLAAQRVLQYIKGSPSQGLFYPSRSTLQLTAYVEAELLDLQLKMFSYVYWAACPDTRRFIYGFCVFLGESLVS